MLFSLGKVCETKSVKQLSSSKLDQVTCISGLEKGTSVNCEDQTLNIKRLLLSVEQSGMYLLLSRDSEHTFSVSSASLDLLELCLVLLTQNI